MKAVVKILYTSKAIKWLLLWGILISCFTSHAQRSYKSQSVLSSGKWYTLKAALPGVYKIDAAFLSRLGINNPASNTIQLFGTSGKMLDEPCNGFWVDDLTEMAVEINDGGDGVFNNNDYLLFYNEGADKWLKDSTGKLFSFEKNNYYDTVTYFLTLGSNGKRISTTVINQVPTVQVNSYNGRFHYEKDSINLLSGGLEWLGQELADLPGRSTSWQLALNLDNLVQQTALLKAGVTARSLLTPSSFNFYVNNNSMGTVQALPVNSDLFSPVAAAANFVQWFQPGTTISNLQLQFIPGSAQAQGWVNYVELHYRRQLVINNNEALFFRDWNSVAAGAIAGFNIANATVATRVWQVTEPLQPAIMHSNITGSNLQFAGTGSQLHEYVVFNPNHVLTPIAGGAIQNQNLHAAPQATYLIITHSNFLTQAQRLAQLHQQLNGWTTQVVTTAQVYNEFSGGNPDPTALRNYVKMYYDRYSQNQSTALKYLLFFGKASFDYKNRIKNNTLFVPTWLHPESYHPLLNYCSDDYFGFLKDEDNILHVTRHPLLNIAIGRLPVKNVTEANNIITKIENYAGGKSIGPWRNNFVLVADDEDQNIYFNDTEELSRAVDTENPLLVQQKLYLDAFPQVSQSGTARYPRVNEQLANYVNNGALIINYSGHGNPSRLADETILELPDVNSWQNNYKLPLLVTATCDFAPYDNPLINSLGENILLRPANGAIGLLTTSRLVFAYSNKVLTSNFFSQTFAAGNHKGITLGDAAMKTKNYTYQNFTDVVNNRKFVLLADPGLRLNLPQHQVQLTTVNGKLIDTLKALATVNITGSITDTAGNNIPDFDGRAFVTVFNTATLHKTLGNDAGSSVATFNQYDKFLYKGIVSVKNGKFDVVFKVPKDVGYGLGTGKISFYAENGVSDAAGVANNIPLGGASTNSTTDVEGPVIEAFMNDYNFVDGSITNNNPRLLLKLADSSGINISGGIGHDITATLNNGTDYYVLNNYYTAVQDSYTNGTVSFQLPSLPDGLHTLTVKAWDVCNNSNETVISFEVKNEQKLNITRVLNYPNPMVKQTLFGFEHNQPGRDLLVKVTIFTVTGKIIKTLTQTINTPGNRSLELEWDGLDDYGQRPGRGVYIYKLSVSVPGAGTKEVIEKLVIL